jgi:peroxin-5
MSFLGGPECSTAANPLNQFMKHAQDDRSLQRDRTLGRASSGLHEGMRTNAQSSSSADAMMDEFMQHSEQMGPMSGMPPSAMEQMRRDFEAASMQQHHNGPQAWAKEFEPGVADNMQLEAAFPAARPKGFSPAEFDRYIQQRHQSLSGPRVASPIMNNTNSMSSWQRPMGMGLGYGGGYGTGMMSQPFTPSFAQQMPAPIVEAKGKGRMIELDDTQWETQFAELEQDQTQRDLDAEAERAVEAELSDIDRSVQNTNTNHLFGDFESVWEDIKTEISDIDRNIYGDFDEDKWRDRAQRLQEWEDFDSDGLNMHIRDPQLGDYTFEPDNPFQDLADPFAEGVMIMDEGGNLSLAALAFESAVKKDPEHVEAWTRLGAAQAQNEKETPAIRALEQAVKLDPTNSDALLGLAVSYTNEGYDSTAHRTLERWLSSKYPEITGQVDPTTGADPLADDYGFTERTVLHERITNLFIQAAQLAPLPEAMDPDVQVGLGVLFYGGEEFEKAVDCFSAALASTEIGVTTSARANQRPLLWNRLGATLANSGRSEEAIQAYEKALELNPNFVRARYNLGVSCINLGSYQAAAEHLLGALSMHQVNEQESREKAKDLLNAGNGTNEPVDEGELERMINQNSSTNLYDTLRRVFSSMGRQDLKDKIVTGVNVDDFRGEFRF